MSNTQVQVSKFQELLYRFKMEFKKAITLAKSMFKAGQTNAELKDTLSELGLAYYYQHKNSQNHLDSQEIKSLISKVDYLEKLMESHEGEIQKVKLAPK
jgi:hypothetical protein